MRQLLRLVFWRDSLLACCLFHFGNDFISFLLDTLFLRLGCTILEFCEYSLQFFLSCMLQLIGKFGVFIPR